MKRLIIIWGIAISTSIGVINAAYPSTEENCIQLTPEKEKVINNTIDKITIFLSKIQEELDDIDIRILRVDIDKHSDQEREEKDLKLKITVNDCDEDDYTDSESDERKRHYKHHKNALQPEETDDIIFNIDQTTDKYKTENTARNYNVEQTIAEYGNVQWGSSFSDGINSDTNYNYSDQEVPIMAEDIGDNNNAQKRRRYHHRKRNQISDTDISNDNIPEYFISEDSVTNPETLPVTHNGKSDTNKATKHHTSNDGSDDATNNKPNEPGLSQTVYDENSMTSTDKNDARLIEYYLPAKRYYKHRHHKRKHDVDSDRLEVASDGIYNAAVIEETSNPTYPNSKEVEVIFDNIAVAYDDIQRPTISKNHDKKKRPRHLFHGDKVIITSSENLDKFETAFVMDSPLPYYFVENDQKDDQRNHPQTDDSLKTIDDKAHSKKHRGSTASRSAIAKSSKQDSNDLEDNDKPSDSDNNQFKEETDNKDVSINTAVIEVKPRSKGRRHHRHHKNRKYFKETDSNYPEDSDKSGSYNYRFKQDTNNTDVSIDDTATIDDARQPKSKKHHHHHHKNSKHGKEIYLNYPEDSYTSLENNNDQFKEDTDIEDYINTDHTPVSDDDTRPKNNKRHHRYKHRRHDEEFNSNYPADSNTPSNSDNDHFKDETDNKDDTNTDHTTVIDDKRLPQYKKHHRHHKHRRHAAKLDSNYPEDSNTSSYSDNDKFKEENDNKDHAINGTVVNDDETQPTRKKYHRHSKNRKEDEEIDDNDEGVKIFKNPDDEVIDRGDELNDDKGRNHGKKMPHNDLTFDDFIRYLEENKNDGNKKCVCVHGLQDW